MKIHRLIGVFVLSVLCLMLGHLLGILITLPEADAVRYIPPIQEERKVFEPRYRKCVPKALEARYICERYE